MKNKAYIVVNEQQEREVLEKLEREGLVWIYGGEKPTKFIPSKQETEDVPFPYAVINQGKVTWEFEFVVDLKDIYEIVYDGRKEEQVSDKYVVSQEFMNELEEWKDEHENELEVSLTKLIDPHEVTYLATIVDDWWLDSNISNIENNNRLIAIIRWVNGEDVFEVEKPKKWVVRSDSKDSEGNYWYVSLDGNEHNKANVGYDIETATRFDTKEEAESWANAHQEVVQVEVDE